MLDVASKMLGSNGTLVRGGTGALPTRYWSSPVKATIAATPEPKPAVLSPRMISGRVAPTPNTRTADFTKMVRLMRYRPEGRKTTPP